VEELQLLKPEDVAKRLKVARVTVYKWARKGVLPYYKLEGSVRFKVEDVKDFTEARRVERGFTRDI
jgi:excisionase family DNA binding protein